MKKAFSAVIILCLMIAAQNSVQAFGLSDYQDSQFRMSTDSRRRFENIGVYLTGTEELELVYAVSAADNGEGDGIKALKIVTENEDHSFDVAIVTAYAESEAGQIHAVDMPVTITENRNYANVIFEPDDGTLIYVTGHAAYTVSGDIYTVYLNPTKTTSTYYKRQNCTVSLLSQSYQTEGTLCDASGNEIMDSYNHDISISQANPIEGYAYTKTQALANGQKIEYTGNMNSGMWITIGTTVNASIDFHTFPIY